MYSASIILGNDFGEIDFRFIEKFTFTSDIYSLYSRANLIIKGITNEIFNKISTGLSVYVIFEDKVNNKKYVNHMCIMSFDKIPDSSSIFIPRIELNLISALYFNDEVSTRGHQNNVSNIINSILSKKNKGIFSGKDISSTEDVVRVRFQIAERSNDFMQKILKYGTIQGLPVYLYTNAKGIVNLKGIYDFLSVQNYKIVCTKEVFSYNEMPENEKTRDCITLLDCKYSLSSENISSYTTTLFSNDSFVPYDIKKDYTSTTLSNTEVDNPQSSRLTPSLTNISPWWIAPMDAKSIAIKNNFDKNFLAYTMEGVSRGMLIDDIYPGCLVKLILPYNPVQSPVNGTYVNLGEGFYIAKNVEYFFSEGTFFTRFKAIQAKY